MTLHLVIEYKWLHELGAHKIFFCPLCHCCYIPRAWIRIRVYVWRWVSACKYIYTYMYVLVLTYISVHMGIIFLLHIMYYLWMIYICLMQLLFNFGNKLIFIVIVIVSDAKRRWFFYLRLNKRWANNRDAGDFRRHGTQYLLPHVISRQDDPIMCQVSMQIDLKIIFISSPNLSQFVFLQ